MLLNNSVELLLLIGTQTGKCLFRIVGLVLKKSANLGAWGFVALPFSLSLSPYEAGLGGLLSHNQPLSSTPHQTRQTEKRKGQRRNEQQARCESAQHPHSPKLQEKFIFPWTDKNNSRCGKALVTCIRNWAHVTTQLSFKVECKKFKILSLIFTLKQFQDCNSATF